MKGARADDPIVLLDDDRDHRRTKKRKNTVQCTGRCHCARDMIIGPQSRASASFQSKCVFAETIEISRCEIKRLSKFFESAKPAIKHYVCEMKRTFVTPGQRMYFSVPFTKNYLMDYISSPIKKYEDHISNWIC